MRELTPPLTLGVHSVVVALLAEKAEVQYDPEYTDPERLIRDISGLGFGAELIVEQNDYQHGKITLAVSVQSACIVAALSGTQLIPTDRWYDLCLVCAHDRADSPGFRGHTKGCGSIGHK